MKGSFQMLTYKKHSFYLNDKPLIIMAGEVHYFRLDPSTWDSHLITLKASGMNTVAFYVPWLIHQELEDKLDLTGKYLKELNLLHFLKLCQKHDLFVFLRPGPFVMAELKNEGIPYWVYKKHPDAIPHTWNKKKVPTPTLDYLNPHFLEEVKQWFGALYDVISPFLIQNHGPIIGIQLDNEVGMLSWVSNAPDLTDDVKHMIYEAGFNPSQSIDTPSEAEALKLRDLLGRKMRTRFLHYLSALKGIWQDLGVKHMLYFINIHGTSHGRGKTFPIGISQLLSTHDVDDFILGTDIYLGELRLENFQDLYVINAMMNSLDNNHKPMTTLEFNTSDGNFGDNLEVRYLPSAIDFKVRMSILQNQRMINYYLLTGGFNPRFNFLKGIDGNDRIAITGERHGFAAPIQPDGKKLYTYPKLKYVTEMMTNIVDKLALMVEETDALTLLFNPDDYMTEYVYPDSKHMKDYQQNLTFHRETTLWNLVLKHALLLHYRYQALYYKGQQLNPNDTPCIMYHTAKYMDSKLQEMLVNYHKQGGKLLLVGELPIFDHLGNPSTILIDYFDVKPGKVYFDWEHSYLSLVSDDLIKNAHEFRTFYAQTIISDKEPVFRKYPDLEPVGFIANNIVWVTSSYPGDTSITDSWLKKLNVKRTLHMEHNPDAAIFSSVQGLNNEKFIHVMNLDYVDYQLKISYQGQNLFDGMTLHLFAQDAYMLPINMHFNTYDILYSTAEIFDAKDDLLTLRLTQAKDVIKLKTNLKITSSPDYDVRYENGYHIVTSNHHAKLKTFITISFS
jgi:beta-galactosidase